MSFVLKSLLKYRLNSQFQLLSLYRPIHFTQVQCLYSPSTLGIDGYLQARKRTKEQFANFSDKFRTKMTEFVSDSKNMIFTEDLKNMVHLAEPTDLELIQNMVKKFNTQSTEFRFGSFVFGPVIMRMFHFLDAPKEALQTNARDLYSSVDDMSRYEHCSYETKLGDATMERLISVWREALIFETLSRRMCFEDPANSGFFDQLVSYQILLDLLYNNAMYEEMYKVFEKVQERQINMTKFPKYPVVLILAACYKQNTPKSLEYATKLWSEMTQVGTFPLRRSATFFAALALKQGAPHIALESISMQKQHYVTLRNIKARALAEMGRVDDALPVLKQVLEVDSPDQKTKHTFFEETIEAIRQAAQKTNNKDIVKEFEDIETALKDRGHIDNQTLDQLVNNEITLSPKTNVQPRGMPFQRTPFGNRQRRNV